MRRKDRPLQRSALETSTSERLAEIVEAAERAAKQVIDDAEAEGRRHLSEAEAEAERIVAERLESLSGVTDSLIAQAEAIRIQSERLLEALEQARAELGADGADEPASAPAESSDSRVDWVTRGSHLTAVPLVEHPVAPVPAPAPDPSVLDREGPAGARLLATQMAVSGNSREEIEARLRNGFEIDDTDAILDAILGPEE
jgi:vacuolar-type H+-ATPase subunit H